MEAFNTLGQVGGAEITLIQTVTQLGAFGLMVFLVIWFVIKVIPKLLDSMKEVAEGFKKHLVEERATHEAERKADRDAFAAERRMDRTEIAGTIERNTLATRELSATFKGVCAYSQHAPHAHPAQTHGG